MPTTAVPSVAFLFLSGIVFHTRLFQSPTIIAATGGPPLSYFFCVDRTAFRC